MYRFSTNFLAMEPLEGGPTRRSRLKTFADWTEGLFLPNPGFYLVYLYENRRMLHPIRDAVRVGASLEMDLFVPDSDLAPHHFTCEMGRDGLILQSRDAETQLNGTPVRSARMAPGDVIYAGTTSFLLIEQPERVH